MTKDQQYLYSLFRAAQDAGHLFPEFAACEAFVESEGGTTEQAIKGHSPFIFRQKAKPLYRSLPIQKRVTVGNMASMLMQMYMAFPDEKTCFTYRKSQLETMGQYYGALRAKTGVQYVREVCGEWKETDLPTDAKKGIFQFSDGTFQFVNARWAVDPGRASAVMAVYDANKDVFSIGQEGKTEEPAAESDEEK